MGTSSPFTICRQFSSLYRLKHEGQTTYSINFSQFSCLLFRHKRYIEEGMSDANDTRIEVLPARTLTSDDKNFRRTSIAASDILKTDCHKQMKRTTTLTTFPTSPSSLLLDRPTIVGSFSILAVDSNSSSELEWSTS